MPTRWAGERLRCAVLGAVSLRWFELTVRSGEDLTAMAVLELHQVGRSPVRPEDLQPTATAGAVPVDARSQPSWTPASLQSLLEPDAVNAARPVLTRIRR
jgi:hypothetical protein